MSVKNPRRILFICTGNTCRSVMAEFLLNKLAADAKLDMKALSCGVAAERYFEIPSGVQKALAREGVGPVSRVAQLVSRELLDWADLALTMTRAHRDAVLEQYPEYTSKVSVLRPYAGLEPADIGDPIGQPDSVYITCCGRILEALKALLKNENA